MRRREALALIALAIAPLPARAEETRAPPKISPSYIAIDTLTGATFKPGGRRGVLTVECGLDIPDARLRTRAEALLPRLRASYLQTVITYAAGLPFGAAPNADFLAGALQRQTDAMLGRGAHLLLGAVLVN